MSFGELSTCASIRYKNLTTKEKKKLEERARLDKERYDTELRKFAKARGIPLSVLKDAIRRMGKKKKIGLDISANTMARGSNLSDEETSNEVKKRKREMNTKSPSFNEASLSKSLLKAEHKTAKKRKKASKIVMEITDRVRLVTLPTITEALAREGGLIEILKEDKFDRLNLIHGPDAMIALKVIKSLCYGQLPDAVHNESKSLVLTFCHLTVENEKHSMWSFTSFQLYLLHQTIFHR